MQNIRSFPVEFKNKNGFVLSGILEYPEMPKYFGIYAHCFTCTKNITAAHVISKTLAEKGYAVLRFDFMGLGESEGDFTQTSLTSNVDDILSAVNFLEKNYEEPSFLIGHSLGGLASLYALKYYTPFKTCITLNAPSNMAHFKERVHFDQDRGYLLNVMGKYLPIKESFVEDVQKYIELDLDFLTIPLLTMHAEDDDIVPFHHALNIFKKSTSSRKLEKLTGMNHLLSKRSYCEQVVELIEPWLLKYL